MTGRVPAAVVERLARLQAFARAHIPVAEAMRIELTGYRDGELTVRAPLAANINHHGTGFGGSQYALAAVAGWALLKLTLEDAGLHGDAVIHSAEVTYERPVNTDLRLTARLTRRERVLAACRKHGRASAGITAEVYDGREPAMRFAGRFLVSVREAGADAGDGGR